MTEKEAAFNEQLLLFWECLSIAENSGVPMLILQRLAALRKTVLSTVDRSALPQVLLATQAALYAIHEAECNAFHKLGVINHGC